MQRGCDSVKTVVGREKLKQSIHPCLLFLERCHARWSLHAFRKGIDGPQLPFLAPGSYQHPHLSMLISGDVPPGVEAFPELFLANAALPKAAPLLSAYLRSV